MRFHEGRSGRRAIINVTSLIDVLFLLVIFVLVSARFEEAGGIAVDLPHGVSKELPESQTLVLSLTAERRLFLDKTEVPAEALQSRLAAAAKRARQTVLIVKADKRVPAEDVIRALDTAKAVGLRQVAFKIRN